MRAKKWIAAALVVTLLCAPAVVAAKEPSGYLPKETVETNVGNGELWMTPMDEGRYTTIVQNNDRGYRSPQDALCIGTAVELATFSAFSDTVASNDLLKYYGQTPEGPTETTWQDMGLQLEPTLEGTELWIYTPEELAWVAQKSLAGTTFVGKTICLKANIDLSAHWWVAIGSGDSEFLGVFDGGGYTVSGLSVGSRQWPSTLKAGFLQGGTLRNTGFSSGEIYGTASDTAVLYNVSVENSYSNVLVAANGQFTDCFLYSRYGGGNIQNSYLRYHAEQDGYAGIYFAEEVEQKLTESQIVSEGLCQMLNANTNAAWAIWETGVDGYPTLKIGTPHPDKYWIGAAEPWVNDETDPNLCLIYTPEQLAQVAKVANQGNSFEGKTIMLMADLNLSGKQWTPIGTYSTPFAGGMEGNYHTIKGLMVGAENLPIIADNAGLFGYSKQYGIKNLILENVALYARSRAGALGASVDTRLISNCSVTGVIFSQQYAGGLVGEGEYRSGIQNCFVDVDVYGETRAGALAATFDGIIKDCYGVGTVSGGFEVGGLVGAGSGTMRNCYAAVDVKANGAKMPGGISYRKDTTINSHWSKDVIHEQDGLSISDAEKKGVRVGTDTSIGNSLEELKQLDTYSNWDFDAVWDIDSEKNGGLPYLRWQKVAQLPVEGVTLSKHDLTLYRGEEFYLPVSVLPANAANSKVLWASTDPAVAVVNECGLVTAVDGGIATITVTTEDGAFTDSCVVTVSKRGRPIAAVINDLQLKTESGQTLTKIPTNGSFLVEASVTIQGQPSADYYVMIAVYDTNGAMCDLSYLRTQIGNGQPVAYAATILNRPGRTIGKIKVVVMDGLSSLVPLGVARVWGN